MIERDLIETPENVELERHLSGIGTRFIAGLVDSLILAGAALALLAILLILSLGDIFVPWELEETIQMWLLALMIAAGFLVYWGYFAFFEWYFNGQTPGKRAVKIRVARTDGAPISFLPVAIRNLLRVVDGIGLYGVAGIVMFATKRAQRLGDLAAGTVVISEQVPEYSRDTDKRSRLRVSAEVSPERLRASCLTPREYHLLHNYWVRRHMLQFKARARLAPKLIQPILQRTGQTLRVMSLEACEEFIFTTLGGTAEGGPGGSHAADAAPALEALADAAAPKAGQGTEAPSPPAPGEAETEAGHGAAEPPPAAPGAEEGFVEFPQTDAPMTEGDDESGTVS